MSIIFNSTLASAYVMLVLRTCFTTISKNIKKLFKFIKLISKIIISNNFFKFNFAVKSYQTTIQSLKKQLEDSNANTSNADIDLIKNLILGYITANATSKTQILKLIANVLNLNDAECIKVGLKTSNSGGGWFSRGGSDNQNNSVSLTEAFVAFLEKESTPRVNPNLLTIHENDTTAVRKSSMESSSSSNTNVITSETPAPIMLSDNNSLLTPYNNRNSSSILKDILHDT